ncbi:MAG: riboflavin synthase [Firmicutes bacterium]|nr:riboflavin synthase [Bacillota bacterium]
MFTGIIEHLGTLEALIAGPEGGRMQIRAPSVAPLLHLGSSLAVNGCCLTVVELAEGVLSFDLSGETLRRTSFGELKPGTRVNLELPLKAGAELGGHFVQGHVDGVGRVCRLVPEGENWWLGVQVPDPLAPFGRQAREDAHEVGAGRGDLVQDRLEAPGGEPGEHLVLQTMEAGHGFQPVDGHDAPGDLPRIHVRADDALRFALLDDGREALGLSELLVTEMLA